MKFRTPYIEEHVRVHSPAGSRYAIQYSIKIEDGVRVLEESGREDIYDSIQKAGPGNILEDLIRRARNGDNDAIPQPVDSFADLTHAPKDMLDAHMKLVEARSKYESLPLQLRAKYGNSFEKFLSAASSGEVVKDLLQPKKTETPPVPALSADDITKLKEMIGGKINA